MFLLLFVVSTTRSWIRISTNILFKKKIVKEMESKITNMISILVNDNDS